MTVTPESNGTETSIDLALQVRHPASFPHIPLRTEEKEGGGEG